MMIFDVSQRTFSRSCVAYASDRCCKYSANVIATVDELRINLKQNRIQNNLFYTYNLLQNVMNDFVALIISAAIYMVS